MFLKEAIWIKNALETLDLHEGQALIDFGSSTEEFRRLFQPYIDYHIFYPLRKKGLRIIHTDLKKDDGVDTVCDLTKPDSGPILQKIGLADIALCTNLLEHVSDRQIVIGRLKNCVKPGGIIIISVPYIYRWHPDPIDTGYRPTHLELADLFPEDEYTRLSSETIEVDEEPVVLTSYPLYLFMRIINRIFKLKLRPSIAKNRVSLIVIRKK
ncbi:MAG: hypothetical protein PHO42_01880 [Candidatus Omnitrophica bacterium]|nr:hypothetical protein [Candidatus Omnitrophota bacterium]